MKQQIYALYETAAARLGVAPVVSYGMRPMCSPPVTLPLPPVPQQLHQQQRNREFETNIDIHAATCVGRPCAHAMILFHLSIVYAVCTSNHHKALDQKRSKALW